MVTTNRAVQSQSAGSAPESAAAKHSRLQKRRIEWPREKIFEAQAFRLAFRIREDQLDIAAKLPKNLPARSAGRGQHIGIGSDCDAMKTARAFGHSFEQSHALRAQGQAVRGVLDVAASVNMAGGI